MKEAAKREVAKHWPLIGIALVLWIATVILRTPAVGINPERIFAVILTSGSMLVIGVMIERIRSKIEQDEEEDEK